MVSKIFIVASLVVTLLGVIGVKEKMLQKRMVYLSLTVVGTLGIAFAQLGQYGLLSGLQQLVFKGLGLVFFLLIVSSVSKKNKLVVLSDLNGMREQMPYVMGLLAVLALFIIGIPGTASFIGMLYAQMGYMYVQTGVVSYVGMVGNIAGLFISSILVFPMLREAFLTNATVTEDDKNTKDRADVPIPVQKPSGILIVIAVVVAIAMVVLSVCHGITTDAVSKLVNMILG